MPSGLPPRERAIRALYGPHYDPAFVRPGVVTDDVEAAIRAAVAEERERCAKIADEYAANAKEDRSVWAAEAIADLIRRAQL